MTPVLKKACTIACPAQLQAVQASYVTLSEVHRKRKEVTRLYKAYYKMKYRIIIEGNQPNPTMNGDNGEK